MFLAGQLCFMLSFVLVASPSDALRPGISSQLGGFRAHVYSRPHVNSRINSDDSKPPMFQLAESKGCACSAEDTGRIARCALAAGWPGSGSNQQGLLRSCSRTRLRGGCGETAQPKEDVAAVKRDAVTTTFALAGKNPVPVDEEDADTPQDVSEVRKDTVETAF